jgi:hypothetical protein
VQDPAKRFVPAAVSLAFVGCAESEAVHAAAIIGSQVGAQFASSQSIWPSSSSSTPSSQTISGTLQRPSLRSQ